MKAMWRILPSSGRFLNWTPSSVKRSVSFCEIRKDWSGQQQPMKQAEGISDDLPGRRRPRRLRGERAGVSTARCEGGWQRPQR